VRLLWRRELEWRRRREGRKGRKERTKGREAELVGEEGLRRTQTCSSG